MKKWLLIVVVMGVVYVIVMFLYYFNIIPHRMYSNDDFDIDTYVSDVDMDNDGIDDQRDILESVREYIATKPKYKSKYYGGDILMMVMGCVLMLWLLVFWEQDMI